jgi:flagellar hook protein FlgE
VAPAFGVAAEDGVQDGVYAGDRDDALAMPWDPYVVSDNSGARDGLTQDATGEWRLINGVNTYVPNFTAYLKSQDGYAEGTLQSVSVDTTGMIVGGFSNGIQQDLAKLALASFENAGGLAKVGETHFTPTANSGNAVIGTALAGGRGSVVGGVLEQSNVDLTVELTNMIVAQRGFEVNARVITTSNNILDTLVNLGR